MIFHARFLQREIASCEPFIGLNAAEWVGRPHPSAAIMDAQSVQTVKEVLSWYACCSGVHNEIDRPDVIAPACLPQQRRPVYGYHPAVP